MRLSPAPSAINHVLTQILERLRKVPGTQLTIQELNLEQIHVAMERLYEILELREKARALVCRVEMD